MSAKASRAFPRRIRRADATQNVAGLVAGVGETDHGIGADLDAAQAIVDARADIPDLAAGRGHANLQARHEFVADLVTLARRGRQRVDGFGREFPAHDAQNRIMGPALSGYDLERDEAA